MQRRRLPEKSVKVEQFPSVELLEIHLSHLQSKPEVPLSVSGQAKTPRSRDYIGTGSLFTFSGGAESTTAEPPTNTALFSIQGESENKFVANYVGSGSFRKLSGAAEAVTFNPDEKQILFSFVGSRDSEKRTSREISKGGTVTLSGTASIRASLAHQGEGTAPISGNAGIARTRDFVGSGFIPTLSGAAESLTFNPEEKQMLFSLSEQEIQKKLQQENLELLENLLYKELQAIRFLHSQRNHSVMSPFLVFLLSLELKRLLVLDASLDLQTETKHTHALHMSRQVRSM